MMCRELVVLWFKEPEMATMCRELVVVWFKEPEMATMCRELVVVWFKEVSQVFSGRTEDGDGSPLRVASSQVWI